MANNKKVKVALIGYGTVGQGVIKILENNKDGIEQRIGAGIEIAAICDVRQLALKGYHCTRDYHEILKSHDIDIVVELIGGYEPARTIILDTLHAGKNIVTANKAVLAKYWDEVFSVARRYGRLVYFEASVGGGIPVIQALNEGLAANQIEKISGILNGTTNYILSEMTKRKVDFKKALSSAQKAGFAEADPSFDIDGIDTAHKLAILSSLAWSSWVKLSDIGVSGIADISDDDVRFAREEYGYVIKLLGSAKMVNGSLDISVQPYLIPETHPFSTVDREYNAILIHGDSVGDVMFYGKGAGQLPAASAVVSDIIELAKQVVNYTAGRLSYVTYDPRNKVRILPPAKSEGCYYLRFTTVDEPGVLAKISGVLGRHGVSIASVYQKEPLVSASGRRRGVPILMLTHRIKYGDLKRALKHIDQLPFTRTKTVKYKIES